MMTAPDQRKWVQLAADIRADIRNGLRKPGSEVSVASLVRRYGYSRHTCGRAVRQLQAEGLVWRDPGWPYIVAGERM